MGAKGQGRGVVGSKELVLVEWLGWNHGKPTLAEGQRGGGEWGVGPDIG